MNNFSQLFGQIKNLVKYFGSDASSPTEKYDSLLLIAAALSRGIVLALLAGLTAWLVRHPLLSPLLATLVVSLGRGYMLAWQDRLLPWRLFLLYFPGLASGEESDSAADRQFRASLSNWLLLLRPVLYFFILHNGFWYWLIPISVLSAAFAHELTSPEVSGRGVWEPWAYALIVTLFVLLAGRLQNAGLLYFPIGLFTCLAIWLFSTWIKRFPIRPKSPLLAAYLGELVICLFLLVGIAF